MIALLSCFMSLLESNAQSISSKGGTPQDSVLISYDDLRTVNSKLVELKYEKDINKNLKEIIVNDSIVITGLSNYSATVAAKARSYKRERNILAGTSVALLLGLIISLFK